MPRITEISGALILENGTDDFVLSLRARDWITYCEPCESWHPIEGFQRFVREACNRHSIDNGTTPRVTLSLRMDQAEWLANILARLHAENAEELQHRLATKIRNRMGLWPQYQLERSHIEAMLYPPDEEEDYYDEEPVEDY